MSGYHELIWLPLTLVKTAVFFWFRADVVVSTTAFSSNQLQQVIREHFSAEPGAAMTVTIVSFGFSRGMPVADLVFDMRFLRNPHYVDALRPLTGQDPAVAAYVEADPDFAPFWRCMTEMLGPLLPRYAQEGKKYLTIALGCTGGKHRSVLAAERLAHHLQTQGWRVELVHRELSAGAASELAAGGGMHGVREVTRVRGG